MKRCSYCGQNYPDDQAVCPVDATPLDNLPGLSSPQVATPMIGQGTLLPAGVPARELLVTVAVLVVCLIAQKIAIPTVDKTAAVHTLAVSNSIFVLGVQPLLSGFVIVELAALLVWPWPSLRSGGRAGREKLRRASLILGMVLALGQGFFVAVAFEKTASSPYGSGFRIITVLILLGATAVLIALARIVDDEGLGGGFPVLLLAFTLPEIARPLGKAASADHGGLGGSALPTEVLGLALLVAATLWLFSNYCLPGTESSEHPALVSRPACGVAPLTVVPAILALLIRLFGLYGGRRHVLPGQFDLVPLVLSLLAAIGFAYLFNRPDRMRLVWKALSPLPPPPIKPAVLESVFFIGLAFLVQTWLLRYTQVPAAIPVILVTGIFTDLVREWRARTGGARLVFICEIHQVYAVPPIMCLLQAGGFHPFAKGLRLRSLLQFFGPYAPVLIMVPAAEAQPACALMEGRWPVLDQPGANDANQDM